MQKYHNNFQLISGQAIANATVRVYQAGTATLATLYADNEVTTKTQPLTTDANGEIAFKAADGDYDIVLDAGSGYESKTITEVHLEDYKDTSSALAASSGSSLVGFAQSGSGASSRTVQAKLRDVVSVTDFGATGDGSTDDTTAFTNAIAALPSVGGALYLPAPSVSYRITSAITIAAKSRLKVIGSSPSGDVFGCQIKWDGINGGTALILDRVRDSYFEDFSIVPGTGTIAVALRIDHVNAPSGSTLSTNNIFKRIGISTSTTGIQIGTTSTANNDLHKFEDCVITGSGTNGYLINNGQSKWIRIIGGVIGNRTNGINVVAGSFHSFGTGFNANTIDVLLGANTDNINIISAQSENSAKFLDDSGANNQAWAVTIQNSRLDPNAVGADNIYIRYRRGGPINLLNNEFGNGVYRAAVRFNFDCASPGSTINSIGNNYPNQSPFTGVNNLVSIGDKGLNSSSLPVELYTGGGISTTGRGLFGGTTNPGARLVALKGILGVTDSNDAEAGYVNPSTTVCEFVAAGARKWQAYSNGLLMEWDGTAAIPLLALPGAVRSNNGLAIPAGGTAGRGFMFSNTANFGVFFGSGVPTLSAAQGSLYLRSDGSSTSTRLYVNTDGLTGWTNVVTAT